MSDRNQSLDAARCVMNYMIVILHAWAVFQYVKWDTIEFISWTVICSHLMWLAIPAFFMISGYLLFQKFSLASWPNKMVRRVKRLAVPYFAWNIFFVAFYLALAHFVPRLGTRVASFGLDTIGGAISKIASLTVAPIDGPLWFLRVLFLFALVSPILWWLMCFARGWALFGATVVWCVVEGMLGIAEPLHLTAPAYALSCFVLGGVLARNEKDLVSTFKHWGWFAIGLAACLIRAAISIPRLGVHSDTNAAISIILSLLAILEAPALISLVSHIRTEGVVKSRVYGFLKEMSFFAYAGHFLFCSMWLHTAAPLLSGMGGGKMTLLILIFVGCGIPTMALVYWLGKRICPRAMKIFDGTL
ncbi:MAG: acyltransferase [Kiritimatiellae bacterium]|nr:acyltransferase [Kiritimatiellia bacterium]